MINVVLYQPEIPGNTGNIMRTCAATNTKLHLIKPLGFSLEEKYIKRSAVNYIDKVNYEVYESFEDFLSKNEGEFYFEKNKARWRLNSISKGEKVVMKGNLITKSKSCICIMNMRAKIEKYSVSGGSLVKVNLIEKDVDKVEKFFKRKTVIQSYEMMF